MKGNQRDHEELLRRHAPLECGRLPVVGGSDVVDRIHLARYRFALPYCAERQVLDLATGIGYGAHVLATEAQATAVIGADISPEALATARERYRAANLRFEQVPPDRLPFDDRSFDVIVSFETVEHTASPASFLAELHRVLRPGGTLVISTPNRRFHSLGRRDPWNPHHTVEFLPEEFHALVSPYFGEPVFWGGQEFLPLRPGPLLRTNWVEFRYYRLIMHPRGSKILRTLQRVKGAIRGSPATQNSGATAEDTAEERTRVEEWRKGLEPYTMVAVFRCGN